jgi:hypothetical protein
VVQMQILHVLMAYAAAGGKLYDDLDSHQLNRSHSGFCGTTPLHCGIGECQMLFGYCTLKGPLNNSTDPAPASIPPVGSCGAIWGGTCPTGKCCSKS